MIRRLVVDGAPGGWGRLAASLGVCAHGPASEPGFILHGTVFAVEQLPEGKLAVELDTHDPADERHVAVPNPIGPGYVNMLVGGST